MIHKFSRYLLTLVALLAMTTGAWADGKVYTEAVAITDLQVGDILAEGAQVSGLGTGSYKVIFDANCYKKKNGSVGTSDFIEADASPLTIGANGVISALSYGEEFTPLDDNQKVVNAWKVSAITSNDATWIHLVGTQYDDAADPEVTISTDQQSAEFDMPSYDATLEYQIVRNLASNMTVSIGDGQDGYRIRVKKEGESFVPAEMTLQQMMALYTVHDATEQKDLLFYGDGKVCDISIYAVDDQGQPTGQPIAFTALTPGRYVAIATAPDDSPLYAGQTPQSNIFVLYQGYEVTVPAGEYITYYRDEPLYVENENAELYTISSVTDSEAQLSSKLTVAPANTPLLVYNNSSTEAKTFLLIPTTDKTPDNVTPATQFVGTLEATTIPASTTGADNYALNGYAFVWVKYAIDVAANKCWLHIESQTATSRANTRSITGGNGTTGIDAIENAIIDNEGWYDLQGRKLQSAPNRKGIYIHNGKKVIVRK